MPASKTNNSVETSIFVHDHNYQCASASRGMCQNFGLSILFLYCLLEVKRALDIILPNTKSSAVVGKLVN